MPLNTLVNRLKKAEHYNDEEPFGYWSIDTFEGKEPGVHVSYDEEKKKFTKIGISIHSVEEAKEAEQLGASYLTAGHIYATDCKRGLPPRGLGFLKEVCREVSIPVYGIGGIKFDEEQWNDMKKCGAVGGCIMSGMMEI